MCWVSLRTKGILGSSSIRVLGVKVHALNLISNNHHKSLPHCLQHSTVPYIKNAKLRTTDYQSSGVLQGTQPLGAQARDSHEFTKVSV